MSVTVRLLGVVKRYKDTDTNAIDDVTFEVAAGESFGLLGPNGAGKTTAVKLICGATAPTAGGVEVWGMDPSTKGHEIKRRIGVVHQHPAFEMMLTVADNLKIAAALKQVPRATAKMRGERLLADFGIEDLTKQLAFTLSGGQQKRLAVVRALLDAPDLLILDEPSAGLDVEGRRHVWSLVHDIRRDGATVIWTSHDMAEIERNCERVAILDRGRLRAIATPGELVAKAGSDVAVIELGDLDGYAVLKAAATSNGFAVHRLGANVEITGENVRERLPVLLGALAGSGFTVEALHFRPPSLEDAFLALIRQESRT